MLIDHTPASCDQDHIDIVISSRASTPDRTAFIMGESKDDPFAVMEQDGFSLVHYGATVIAIPCNTAHYFYDRLAEALPVPVLNMPRLTVADAKAAGCTKLGILATDGTLQAETYQIACRDAGIEWAAPAGDHQDDIMSVIYDDIKQGRRADMAKFGGAVHDLKKQGCDMAVLGCTELSLVKRDEHLGKFFIDQRRGALPPRAGSLRRNTQSGFKSKHTCKVKTPTRFVIRRESMDQKKFYITTPIYYPSR